MLILSPLPVLFAPRHRLLRLLFFFASMVEVLLAPVARLQLLQIGARKRRVLSQPQRLDLRQKASRRLSRASTKGLLLLHPSRCNPNPSGDAGLRRRDFAVFLSLFRVLLLSTPSRVTGMSTPVTGVSGSRKRARNLRISSKGVHTSRATFNGWMLVCAESSGTT